MKKIKWSKVIDRMFCSKKMCKNACLSVRQGFSLVEVLVSLLVISFGILGVSALMFSSIKNSVEAKNQVVASNLAQEGIELIRNLNEGGIDVANGDYEIDYNLNAYNYAVRSDNPVAQLKNDSDGNQLYQSNATGAFGYVTAGGSKTKFSRKITISTVSSNKKVLSWVSWDGADSLASMTELTKSSCTIASKCLVVEAISAQ